MQKESNNKFGSFFKSLSDVTKEQTERKNPGENSSANTYIPKGEKYTENPIDPPENNPNPEPDKEVEPEKIKLPEERILSSGKTGAYLVGGIMETVFGLTERVVYLSKFSEAEKNLILELQEKDEKEFTDREKSLNRKFLAITKKHNEIRAKIPLDEKDEQALIEGFSEYTRATGKTLNPTLIIWSVVVKVMSNRAIDIFM